RGVARLGIAAGLGGLARRRGLAFGLGFLAGFLGQPRLLRAPHGLGAQAGFLGAARRLGLLGNGFFQVADQVRQAAVIAPQLARLGALRGDLSLEPRQQGGPLFLLGDQFGLLFGGLGRHFLDFVAARVGLGLQGRQAVQVLAQRRHGLGAGARYVA